MFRTFKHEYDVLNLTTKNEVINAIEKYGNELEKYEWTLLEKSPAFKIEYATDYLDKLNWDYLSVFYNFTEDELIEYEGYYQWYPISAFNNLSIDFIKNHKDILSLDVLYKNDKLTKDAAEYARKLYLENNDDQHQTIWLNNLSKCKIMAPKNINTKIIKKKPRLPKEIDKMSKDECKEFLDKYNIKYLYKDTLDILRKKCLDLV